jgi:hypothetical protein
MFPAPSSEFPLVWLVGKDVSREKKYLETIFKAVCNLVIVSDVSEDSLPQFLNDWSHSNIDLDI